MGPYRTSCPPQGYEQRAYCPRCRGHQRVVRPWRGWRRVRWGFRGVLGCIVITAPVWAMDPFVMTPTALAIAAASGPLERLATEPPTCRRCGLCLEADGRPLRRALQR
ncbi:MAG: hypothetical protein ACOCUS_05725 [Polyangiales bacterium]